MLSQLPLFLNIQDDELLALEQLAKEMTINEGEFLFHAGEGRNFLYVILEGKIKVFDPAESDESIAIIEKGYPVSEEALMDVPGVHSKSAQSIGHSMVLALSSSAFKGFMVQHPRGAAQILKNIAEMLAQRLKSSNRRIITIYRIGKILSDSTTRKNTTQLTEKILTTILLAIKATKGIIVIFNKHTQKYEAPANYGYPTKDLAGIVNLLASNPSFKTIMGNKKTMVITGEQEIHTHAMELLGSQSLIISPMTNDETFGAIILGDKKDPHGFSTRNETLLSIISKEISFALAEANLLSEKQAEKDLKRVYIEGL